MIQIYYLIAKQERSELPELGEPAVEPLIEALKYKDWYEDWYVREEAAEALGKIGDIRAVKPLIEALKDEYRYVRLKAAKALGKIGDIRAVEAVIKSLFEFPSELRYSSSLINLFGDYTDLILKACSYRRIERSRDRDSVSYDYDLQEAIAATKRLCDIRTPISSNILLLIAKRRDIEVISGYSCAIECKGTLSFKSQRKIAKEELERRGNPPYEPSAYLKKEAWKL